VDTYIEVTSNVDGNKYLLVKAGLCITVNDGVTTLFYAPNGDTNFSITETYEEVKSLLTGESKCSSK